MVRKKGQAAEETKPMEQIPLFVPEQPQTPPSPPLAPTSPGALALPPPKERARIETPAFLEKICADAIEWAKECGLKPPFRVNGPDRVEYQREGHGYVVTIKEETGKQRLGSARFNSNGTPTYWSLDGIVTG